MKDKIKQYLDGNVWDGDDRSGCENDWAKFDPDMLQELVEECLEHVTGEDLIEDQATITFTKDGTDLDVVCSEEVEGEAWPMAQIMMNAMLGFLKEMKEDE